MPQPDPTIVALERALPHDPKFKAAIIPLIQRETDTASRWEGWRVFFHGFDATEWMLDKVAKHLTSAKSESDAVEEVFDNGEDTPQFTKDLESAIREAMQKAVSEREAHEAFEDALEDLRENAEYSSNPSKYHGVSNRDFMASSLRHNLIRLATAKPELRKHIVPLLRKH